MFNPYVQNHMCKNTEISNYIKSNIEMMGGGGYMNIT